MYWLFRMNTFTGSRYCASVPISWMFISTLRLAGDVDHQRVGMRDLHAHRRRQAIAHGAQAAAGHPVVRLLELEMLRGPHLVLADLGGDEDLLASPRASVHTAAGSRIAA